MALPTGCKFLIDPNQIAGADGATLASLTDQSGNGTAAIITYQGSGNIVLRRDSLGTADCLEVASGRALRVAPDGGVNRASGTFVLVWGASVTGGVVDVGQSNNIYISANNFVEGQLKFYQINGIPHGMSDIAAKFIIRMDGSNNKIWGDGVEQIAGGDTGSNPYLTIFGDYLGNYYGQNKKLYFAAYWDRALSNADRDMLISHINGLIDESSSWQDGQRHIVIAGTSIARGSTATNEQQTTAGLLRAAGHAVANRGWPSSYITDNITWGAAGRFDLFPSNGAGTYLWFDYPTNDVNGINQVSLQTSIGTFCAARRAESPGVVVVGTDLLPRSSHNITTVTQAYNAAYIAEYDAHPTLANVMVRKSGAANPNLPDYLIRWSQLSGMATHTDTGFSDGIHPRSAGYAVLGERMNALLATLPSVPLTVDSVTAGPTGRYIDLAASGPLTLGITAASDFTLTYGAGNTPLLVSSVALQSANTIRLTLASTPATPLYANDTNVLLDYTSGAGKISDSGGNLLASFTDTAVSVASAPAAPVVVPPATINTAGDELTIPYDSNVFRTPTVAMAGYTLTLQNPLPSSSLIYTVSPLVSSTATPSLTVDGAAVAVTNNSTVDGVPPVVTAIDVASTGLHLDVTCSEAMSLTATSGADFTLTYGVGNTVVSVSSVALLTASIIRLTLASALYSSDTNVLLDFVGGANKIEDAAGNDLAAFTNSAVSVASAPAAPVVVPPATINAAGNVLTVPFDSTVHRTPTVAMPGYTLTLTTVLPAGTLAYSIAPPVEQGASPSLTVNGASVAVTNGSTVPPSVAPPTNITLRMEVSGTLIIRITGE